MNPLSTLTSAGDRVRAGQGHAVGRRDLEADFALQLKLKTRVGTNMDFFVGIPNLYEIFIFFAQKGLF
jgi:hypothetical protein